jgi:ATP-dependent protease ClpP protease subunit
MSDHRQWYAMARAETGDAAVIRIFGDIGESWWGDSVSAAQFAADLDEIGEVKALEVRLNSPGGDMFDGVAIYNTLRNHPARVTAYVDGLAASAASVVAMGADEVVMGTGTQLMIHDAWALSVGNADEMRAQAAVMDQLSDSMADIYADRTGGAAAEWRDTMRAESWFGADEAVEAGLADRVVKRDPKAGDTASDTGVAAAVRTSKFAAKVFRYQGRAHAPAPHAPARPGGSTSKGGAVAHEFTDEEFTALREKLGLGEDAATGDLLDALDDKLEQATKPAPAAEPVAASLPEGVVAIERNILDELRRDAAAGAAARAEQVRARRTSLVDAAARTGKIRAADRERWLKNLELDPEGYEDILAKLEPGLAVNTVEHGYDDGSVEAPDDAQAVVASPKYKGWTV